MATTDRTAIGFIRFESRINGESASCIVPHAVSGEYALFMAVPDQRLVRGTEQQPRADDDDDAVLYFAEGHQSGAHDATVGGAEYDDDDDGGSLRIE